MDERARLLNVKELLTLYDLARAKVEKDVSVGDIVACFGNDDTLIGIGTVKHVGHVRLSPHHEDGEFGEVFVLPYSKTRINKRKDLTGVVAFRSTFTVIVVVLKLLKPKIVAYRPIGLVAFQGSDGPATEGLHNARRVDREECRVGRPQPAHPSRRIAAKLVCRNGPPLRRLSQQRLSQRRLSQRRLRLRRLSQQLRHGGRDSAKKGSATEEEDA